jgi:hypothetical protein
VKRLDKLEEAQQRPFPTFHSPPAAPRELSDMPKKAIPFDSALGASQRQAVIYSRVSSKDQEKEGFSIPAQLDLLRGYAGANGYAIAQEFVDVETAKAAGRTGFGEMIAFLKKHTTCRTVLVEKTDRLYRNLRDWVPRKSSFELVLHKSCKYLLTATEMPPFRTGENGGRNS